MLSREEFKNSIATIKAVDNMITDLYDMGIDIIDNKAIMGLISNHSKLLSIIMEDKVNDIEYFIYDLEFGKSYKPGVVTDRNGNNIDFSTEDKLYDYLTANKATNENTIKNMSTDELAEYINSVFRAGEMFGKGMLTTRDFENYKEWLTKKSDDIKE